MDSCFVCLFCHSVKCHGPPTTLRYHSVLVSKLTYYHRSTQVPLKILRSFVHSSFLARFFRNQLLHPPRKETPCASEGCFSECSGRAREKKPEATIETPLGKKLPFFLCCPDFCCTTQRLLHFWYVYLRLDLPMGAEWRIRAPLQSNSALRKMLVRLDFWFVCWAFYSSQLFCCWTNSWAIDI